MICVYGIKNCDTIKKARKWLEASGHEYRFHDYRADGLERPQLEAWVQELGWDALLNRRGTTWRAQPDEVKNNIDEAGAIALMLEHPAMIKRPLLDTGDARHLGFKAETWATLLGGACRT